MRGAFAAKLALGVMAIFTAGCLAGMGLANYVTSGTFDFYRQQRVSEWRPTLPPQPAVLESTDPAFASDRPDETGGTATERSLASLTP
jgi:transcription initiation factor TFIID subunit TAF12